MVSGTMEEAPSIDTVYGVVNTLYTVPAESHRASMWLDDFSQSVRNFGVKLFMKTPEGARMDSLRQNAG